MTLIRCHVKLHTQIRKVTELHIQSLKQNKKNGVKLKEQIFKVTIKINSQCKH